MYQCSSSRMRTLSLWVKVTVIEHFAIALGPNMGIPLCAGFGQLTCTHISLQVSCSCSVANRIPSYPHWEHAFLSVLIFLRFPPLHWSDLSPVHRRETTTPRCMMRQRQVAAFSCDTGPSVALSSSCTAAACLHWQPTVILHGARACQLPHRLCKLQDTACNTSLYSVPPPPTSVSHTPA